MRMTFRTRVYVLLGLAAAMFLALIFLPAIPQDQHYHSFADQRVLFNVPNALDVFSNVFFLIAGLWGFWNLRRTEFGLSTAYIVFLLGLILTCFGSAFYHLSPSNEGLFWDRLPMSVAFMALLSLLISLRISPTVGRRLLWPLLLLGILSVVYWLISENMGQGDLRFYGLVQFGGIALSALILFLFPGIYPRRSATWGIVVGYALAKVFEIADEQIFNLTAQTVSGHTLKHIVAGFGAWIFVWRVSVEE